jgi:hypothetical protein
MKTRFLILLVLAMLALVVAIPFKTTTVPDWEVQIVDINGVPLADKPVRQEWSYSDLFGYSTQVINSNENGIVRFPEREFWAPLLIRFLVRAYERANSFIMPHGSRIGSYSRVMCESGTYYWLEYHDGQELEHTLIVKKL